MVKFLTVTKKYQPTISALEEVTFDINEGEFVFMVGPSGSGKTTIIRLLIREEDPSIGKIFFDNEDITKYNRNKVYKLRRKIGVIFQDFKLIPEMTAYENISFAMEAAGRSEKEIKENVPYLLDIVGLTSRMKSFPHQLSGGEKQRVAIARAMANNPKLLIADEPTGNLDPDSAWDVVPT
jgi:cell division transport system ATP-binding protein